jgi:hypothetical protein
MRRRRWPNGVERPLCRRLRHLFLSAATSGGDAIHPAAGALGLPGVLAPATTESLAYELSLFYSQPDELLMDLLRYGPDVKVIEPPSLRELVARTLADTLDVYR